MAKSTCKFTKDDIMATEVFQKLTPAMKKITKNKRNIIAIYKAFQQAKILGYQDWEKSSQSNYTNKLIIRELVEKTASPFKWESNFYLDDFICKMDNYTLRIEALDEKNWWWQLYFRNDAIAGTWFCDEENYWPDSKDRAMELCEEAYLKNLEIN